MVKAALESDRSSRHRVGGGADRRRLRAGPRRLDRKVAPRPGGRVRGGRGHRPASASGGREKRHVPGPCSSAAQCLR